MAVKSIRLTSTQTAGLWHINRLKQRRKKTPLFLIQGAVSEGGSGRVKDGEIFHVEE